MITEDYVSFETAKLLKEKGFNVPIYTFYNPKKSYMVKIDPCKIDRNAGTCVSAPTLQMAMKWLREVHNIVIIPYFDKLQSSDLPYSFAVYIVDEYARTREIIACFDIDENLYWSKQEQAVEAAIKYWLKNEIKYKED